MNSRAKGAKGERELAKELRHYGYDARRGQQYSGANGDADVVGLPGIHIECKRVQKLNIYDAYMQSRHDAREGEIPVVMHRKNDFKWKVTLSLLSLRSLCYGDTWLSLHVESKVSKRLNIDDAYMGAWHKAGEGKIPVLAHKREEADLWKVTLSLEDFMTIYREWEAGR